MTAGAALQVTTTLDSREAAERLAGALVDERLAACVQISGPVTSVYRWQGAVERAEEWYCHIKTTPERFAAVADAIRARHSYQTPEIVATSLAATPDYAAWVRSATGES